ncbi:glycoside hydrolase family 3 C-terminal domain-containing protein [Actinoplanes sp. NEAU-A12]|uniref:Glycoside hydrolase family 3 C-terminal domain-containing protein n=1 Tax=Actinoplanes sandaracinus TaxID=3045177 RepID=A0ABT6WQB8_9ACTN|nr:glycoside hydrolase family 3 protein [Actinoplanes sandaracinus]MDI6101932.1 glycoside hydrolase family 3 C-terminal domain-containing protein [Actinoplanes sandaracinus]
MTESPSRIVFRDPQQKLAARVSDLLGRLDLAEKIALLHQHQAPVPRLGIGPFRTGTEALHGVAWLGAASAFPQAVGLASSWDTDLLRRVGTAVGTEVRAMHHRDPANVGLNVWAPVVNLLRDPRWGRNEEGYAEDPWLTGVLSTAYSGGLRGDDPRWLRTAPTLKHFLGYNNETDRCITSSNMPPRVLHEYELPAFRPALADGAAVAVMASYNLINGRPTHLSPLINEVLRGWSEDDVMVVGDAYAVQNLAGDQQWCEDHPAGFAAALRAGIDCVTEPGPLSEESFTTALDRGLITESDVDAAVRHILSVRVRLGEFNPDEDPYRTIGPEVIDCPEHRVLAREAARASVVLLANDGILPLDPAGAGRIAVIGPLADTTVDDWYSGTPPYRRTLRAAIAERIGAGEVLHHEGADRLALRCAAGLLVASADETGGPLRIAATEDVPAEALFDVLDWGEETFSLRAVANGRFAGADGLGAGNHLLVNDRPGPNGWEVRETFRFEPACDGLALRHVQSRRYLVADADGTVRTAAESAADATVFTVDLLIDGVAAAAAVAAEADVVVLALGNHPLVAGRETEDRRDLALPGTQDELLRAVHAANPRTVLALASSYPYAIGWARENLPALLWSAHGGQEHGAALADVLFGSDPAGLPVDPSARLTQTWYSDAGDLPDLLDYDIIATDATYLYYRGTPLFPFGHGLSYTRFHYENLRISAGTIDAAGEVTVTVDVVNTGDRPGVEVVQLYTRQQRSRVKQPLRRLRGHRRVRLAPGERSTVELSVPVAELAFWDVTRSRWVIEDATHTIAVGRSSTDWRLTTTLRVRGEHIPPRSPRSVLKLIDNDGYAETTPVATKEAPGEALRSERHSAWAVFDEVDFGGGLSAVRALVAATALPAALATSAATASTAPAIDTVPASAASASAAAVLAATASTAAIPATVASVVPAATALAASAAAAAPAVGGMNTTDGSRAGGSVLLRLDDPISGPILATIAVPVAPTDGELFEVTAPLPPVTGVHALFVLFEQPGITVATLSFEDSNDPAACLR